MVLVAGAFSQTPCRALRSQIAIHGISSSGRSRSLNCEPSAARGKAISQRKQRKERRALQKEKERREDGREGVVWMTDTVSQWLAGPETLSSRPEMLGGLCPFRQELCVLLERLSQKLEVPWAGLCTGRGGGGHPKVPKGTRRWPRMQNALQRGFSDPAREMAASGPERLYTQCPANQGRWRSARAT